MRMDDLRDKSKSFEKVKGNKDLFIAQTAVANIELNKKYSSEIISSRAKEGTVQAENQVEQLKITPVNANPSVAQQSANQVLFKEVYDDVDMLKTVVKRGVKEDLILKEIPLNRDPEEDFSTTPATANSARTDATNIGYIGEGKWQFEYEIKTDLFAVIEKGKVNYYNSKGNVAMYHPAPYMLDAEGKRSEKAYWTILSQTEELIRLQLFADTKGLVYPIALDPTTYITFTDEANYTQEDVKRKITNWVNDGVGEYSSDAQTQLLLHADGDRGNTGHDVTVNGDPVITNTTKFAEAVYFDGAGDYLEIPDHADWSFGTGDFAIDFWVYFEQIGEQILISREDYPHASQENGGTGGSTRHNGNIRIMMQPAGNLAAYIYAGGNDVISMNNVGNNLETHKWYHVALNRSGSTARLFLDGKITMTDTSASGNHTGEISDLVIGSYANFPALDFKGYMDDIRITKGDARWIANFTPATSAVNSDTNTKLLIHADGAEGSTSFTDSGNTVHAVNAVGDSKITGFSNIFGDTIYFDGNGDYLSIPDSDDFDFGNGDFTIDGWIYTKGGSSVILEQGAYANRGFQVWLTASRQISLYLGPNDVWVNTTTNTVPLNQWTHFAITRDQDDISIYIDGVLDSNFPQSHLGAVSGSSSNLYVGIYNGVSSPFTGYMDDLRITKGEALWETGFMPPTVPATVTTNTNLLLDFE